MANQPFDRTILNPRERPLGSDVNQMSSQSDRTLRALLGSLFAGRTSNSSDFAGALISGFINDSFKVRPLAAPAMSVRLAPGYGFLDNSGDVPSAIGGVLGLDDLERYKPLILTSELVVSGITAPTVNPRIDIVEVRMNRVSENPLSRDVLDTVSGLFVPGLVNKTLNYHLDGGAGTPTTGASTAPVGYKKGTEAAVPVAPTVTAGYVKIAEVRLTTGTTTLTRAEVLDFRNMLAPGNDLRVSCQFSVPNTASPPVLLNLIAPAGIEVVCRKITNNSDLLFLYIIGGGITANSKLSASASLSGSGNSVDGYMTNGLNVTVVPSGLDSSAVAAMLDAVKSGPVLQFAVGQPYCLVALTGLHQLAGATNTTMENPMFAQFDVAIRR